MEKPGVNSADEQNESNFQRLADGPVSARAVFVKTIFQQ